MAGETIITVVGNLTADPELRYTPSGAAVTNFVIASTPRYFDRQANEFKDAETLFVRCSLWREAAENVVESLTKGTRVIAQGRLKARSYQDKEGNNRTSWELDVDEIGPSLRFATAQVQRQGGGGRQGGGPGGGFGGGGNQGGFGGGDAWGSPGPQGGGPQQDPWGGQPSQGGGWDAPGGDEPPF
ncbi:single-stranded DNA-binding protein [Nesterenkonia sp. MY13]|uniref:Single-stranded DNA-binding protein n=1 Tax=Nesterenkonia sedimenti TaxID=1463632 RepID=A0A7X8TLB2_9MICC|nr:single-stranded DNA-binding protein [Nesterenkonia sedimenti]NLS10457.1 single-stranded DNA-binding protein [Nesterenkonia sedimenti]